MFDIDGTLAESFTLDTKAFLDAFRDVFGFDDVSDDWASYQHVTDAGIFSEVFASRRGRTPSPEETSRVQTHFVALLSARVAAAGGIQPIRGAADILARLLASQNMPSPMPAGVGAQPLVSSCVQRGCRWMACHARSPMTPLPVKSFAE